MSGLLLRAPDLRKKLTPTFQFGCKRVLVSDDYWATFERDDVELVTDSIERIDRAGGRAMKRFISHEELARDRRVAFTGVSSAP